MTLDAFLQHFAPSLGQGPVVALGVAMLAGIMASGVCPCTLPMGLGMAGVIGASESRSRSRGFIIAASFFIGIVVNLMLLGCGGRSARRHPHRVVWAVLDARHGPPLVARGPGSLLGASPEGLSTGGAPHARSRRSVCLRLSVQPGHLASPAPRVTHSGGGPRPARLWPRPGVCLWYWQRTAFFAHRHLCRCRRSCDAPGGLGSPAPSPQRMRLAAREWILCAGVYRLSLKDNDYGNGNRADESLGPHVLVLHHEPGEGPEALSRRQERAGELGTRHRASRSGYGADAS